MPARRRLPPQGAVPGPYLVYHRDIGFPSGVDPKSFIFQASLSWSPHARQEAERDRYGSFGTPETIDTTDWTLIEVKVNKHDGKVGRTLFRSPPAEDGRCTCLVMAPMGGGRWKVITAWINEANDTHRTLDHSRYDKP